MLQGYRNIRIKMFGSERDTPHVRGGGGFLGKPKRERKRKTEGKHKRKQNTKAKAGLPSRSLLYRRRLVGLD